MGLRVASDRPAATRRRRCTRGPRCHGDVRVVTSPATVRGRPPAAPLRPGEVPLRRGGQALCPRRHLRNLPAARRGLRVPLAGGGRGGLRARWPRTGSTRSAPTPSRRGGCSTAPPPTACGSWSGCPGSSTSPSWTTGPALARSRTGCATGSGRAPAIPRSSATRSATRSPPRSSAGTAAAAVERFLERLYVAAKEEDPDGLVTYVNFPSTEYLELPFLDLATFNVYLERPAAVGGLPRAAAEPRRRPAAAHGRDRARQPPARRRRAGPRAALAGRDRGGRGLRRRLRLRLDRRVAPRRPRHRGLGLRPDDARPATEARAGSGARGVRPDAARARRRLAADVGRRLHLQRRGDPARLPRRPAEARLPGLRGDRGRRRVHRRDGRDRRRVPVPGDQHREPRPERRTEHRPRARRPARSSPTPTTTPGRTRTG